MFFPVCSIRLGDIKKEWGDEKIHLIQYNEDPYNRDTVKFFTDYCKDNMIAFDVEDSKYSFRTDFGYFDLTDDWKEWYTKTRDTYSESKSNYEINGDYSGIDTIKLGGEPEWWQEDQTPLDPDGVPMTFVTEFETDNICNDYCDNKIYLFYSHKFKLAVQVYQIT